MSLHEDEKWMCRCLQLAERGRMGAPPNPMVGAVVVHEGRILGEGYHRQVGTAHAEVNAIAAVPDRLRHLLPDSTLYVNLEPCAHHGRTPPCCELITHVGFKRVVVGMVDPFAEVSGRGIAHIRAAGIMVTTGVLEDQCRALNRVFITYHAERRPYVTLKWAQSADGYLDGVRADSTTPAAQLSNTYTTMHVHHMRAMHDAILVGGRTALLDNPRLNTRYWHGTSPLRIVLAGRTTLPHTLQLLSDGQPTLVYGEAIAHCTPAVAFAAAPNSIAELLADLHVRGIQRLMVEGGARVLQAFLNTGLWDEAYVEHASMLLGQGVAAPHVPAGTPAEHTTLWGVPVIHYDNTEFSLQR
ncbi:MAG: bifunctional diaminohydroxyphosphoribosylaminopyrimidine deaminase/5-amino-6-(5-phosphoribosylamino)uracil reductase RibD [Bacteroidales bacterium]|nr:bifunctional diaminohydroxyphosphoribosylaminopyrimidine deaminase/5-amino-6-(5-phosphoribosylamino)uracil reductase RibD [Bacteroidales bacterium]